MLLGNRYQLLSEPLSTGSFGSIYVADDNRMPRRVAVKVLHPEHAKSPSVRARFRRELEAACLVQHENVVNVHDIGEDERLGLYYVMELVRGTALKDFMSGEPLPWPFIRRVAVQLCKALHAIHTADIVHRDLKPQNIMLVERSNLEELVKVLDFGIAALKSTDDDADIELTGARMVLGTPPYMSPEQTYMRSDRERLKLEVSPLSDIYGLGVILYEMATGRRPFSGDAHDVVIAHRLTKPMPLERMAHVTAPPEFRELVMRCLEKAPADRPQSARDILTRLRRIEDPPDVQSERRPAAEQRYSDEPTVMVDAPLTRFAAPPVEAEVEPPPAVELDDHRRLLAWTPVAVLLAAAAALIVVLASGPPGAHNQHNQADSVHVDPSGSSSLAPRSAVKGAAEAPVISQQAGVVGEQAPEPMGHRVDGQGKASDSDQARASDPPIAAEAETPKAVARGPQKTPPVATTAGVVHAPSPPVAAEVSPALAKPAVLKLTTTPAADVYLDGSFRGQTPMSVELPVETSREVRVSLRRSGYDSESIVVRVGPARAGETIAFSRGLRALTVPEARPVKKRPGRRKRDHFEDL